jgi:Dihydrofolate reductase
MHSTSGSISTGFLEPRLVRQASHGQRKWPKISIWHGSHDGVVAPANASALVRQWIDIPQVDEAGATQDEVDGQPRMSWRDSSGAVVVEHCATDGICAMDTRNRAFDPSRGGGQPKAIHVAHELDAALALALAQAMGAEEVILAGGGKLYESLIGRAERMHLTFVDIAPRGEVSFPAIDWSNWLEVSRVRPRPAAKDEAAFAFVDFDRRRC